MKSIATHHFPQVIVDGKKKWLFNPILKKRFANRPEERVRLRWVEYLLLQTNRKRSRIGFETPVKLRQESNRSRADPLLYSGDLTPQILVECKSESISLTPKVAEQAARYNVEVNADYVVLTNGVVDYWFTKSDQQVHNRPDSLYPIDNLNEVYGRPGYWTKRGFCSSQSSSNIEDWLNQFLPILFHDKTLWNTRYLDFKESLLKVPMDHYYRVADYSDEIKIAITTLAGTDAETFLVGIINRKGVNHGVVSVKLNELLSGSGKPIAVFKGGGKVSKDCKDRQKDMLMEMNRHTLNKLPEFFMSVFD